MLPLNLLFLSRIRPVCSLVNLTTASSLQDWIRSSTPRKPTRFKLHKAFTVLENEFLELNQPKLFSLPQNSTFLHQSIYDAVNTSISENGSQYFAVVAIAGKQFKVTNNDLIMVKTPFYGTDVGDRVQLQKVLLLGSSDFTIIGRPILPVHQVFIEAVVIEKTLEHPKVWYQFHRRRRHHKLRGK
ncbi:unnamed protein product [Schistosoma turkestanicum]|nr:unnamed protein product [Schistosoma turkestanicum]